MSDLTVKWNPTKFAADLVLGADDILTGSDLETNVATSLFTDPEWWANKYEPDDWGCRIVEVRRAKHTNGTLLAARDYCQAALQWLLDDQVAATVDVQTAWYGSTLGVTILVTQATGVSRFSFVWDQV